MKNGYLQTVSTVAIGSLAFGAAVAKKAEAQDGYTLSFSGGIGEASGLNFESGGFSSPDLGYYGSIMVSKPFGVGEGYVGLSFYNQDSNQSLSGFSGPSGGSFSFIENTKWFALDVGTSQQTGTPGLAGSSPDVRAWFSRSPSPSALTWS